ncbi:MAG TPA: hypothetical protein VLM38_18410 [Blastocatellia bacterium]|nr:hypothetical protein [Blastocatellia bacterium]
MKRSRFALLCGVAVFVLLASSDSFAQSNSSAVAGTQPEQVIKDLLSEVHQLRVAMQHMSVNAYRAQIMVERLRLQQDQVTRLARELSDTRNGIAELKAYEPVAKERLEDAENQFDRGVLAEPQLKQIRANLADMKRRQQALIDREAQLSLELDQERNNLAELNKRLDALEREMMMTGLVDAGKGNAKE